MVAVLASLPFATATGVGAFVLPGAERDPRLPAAKVQVSEPPAPFPEAGSTLVKTGSRTDRRRPGPPVESAVEPAAEVPPAPAQSEADLEWRPRVEVPTGDRPPATSPRPRLRVPSPKAPGQRDGGGPGQGDESGPAPDPAPPAPAPAPTPPPADPAPPPATTEQPPPETEPDGGAVADPGSEKPERRGPPPGRGGGRGPKGGD
jgi:hypothetical protein